MENSKKIDPSTRSVKLSVALSDVECATSSGSTLSKAEWVEWILRIAVAGEFVGHGVFALQGKKAWIGWIRELTGAEIGIATTLLTLIGLTDLLVALIVLVRPIRAVVLWAAVWGFWTALVRPIVGESIWDFVERWANWGAPLALFLLRGWPKNWKEWLK